MTLQPAPNAQRPESLTLPIVSMVLAFVPFLCIGGVICAHNALKNARRHNDEAGRIISIVALVVGYLSVAYTAFILLAGGFILFKPIADPPDFEAPSGSLLEQRL